MTPIASLRRQTAWLLFLSFALAIAPMGCEGGLGRASGDDASPAPAVLVRATTLALETRSHPRRFSGYTYPWEAAGIGFLVSGRVTAMHVEEGDRVEKGQLIAEIAPEDFALVRRLAEVQVKALEPNVARVDRLVKERVLPVSQYDEIHGKYRAALTQRDRARRQLEYTRLMAPFDGVVMKKKTSAGQVIATGSPALVLLDLAKMRLRFGVVQQDLRYFQRDQSLRVVVPGLDETRTAVVHHIASVPDGKTRTFEITAVLDNPVPVQEDREGADDGPGKIEPARPLRAGLLAHVELDTDLRRGLFAPLLAIRRGLSGEHLVSVVGEGARVEERVVSLGGLYGDEVQILGGLAAGDRLIVEGQGFVSVGDEVRVR
jgi:multidrug efflux pump subunit AcrA (membrane-fusion protein)